MTRLEVVLELASGVARIGPLTVRAELAPAPPSLGAAAPPCVRLGGARGPLVRGLTFAERRHVLACCAGSRPERVRRVRELVRALSRVEAGVAGPLFDPFGEAALDALCLHLCGADSSAPGFERTLALAAGARSWTLAEIEARPALEIDRLAAGLADSPSAGVDDGGVWTRLVLAPSVLGAAPGPGGGPEVTEEIATDLEALVEDLCERLLARAAGVAPTSAVAREAGTDRSSSGAARPMDPRVDPARAARFTERRAETGAPARSRPAARPPSGLASGPASGLTDAPAQPHTERRPVLRRVALDPVASASAALAALATLGGTRRSRAGETSTSDAPSPRPFAQPTLGAPAPSLPFAAARDPERARTIGAASPQSAADRSSASRPGPQTAEPARFAPGPAPLSSKRPDERPDADTGASADLTCDLVAGLLDAECDRRGLLP